VEVLRADSIHVRFGERRVLSSATLRAEERNITVLLGRNGQGKSTLLRVAAGLLQPDGGTVQFRGETYLRPRLATLAQHGLFLLADRDLLSPTLTLRRQLEWFAVRYDRPYVEQAAELVGLRHVLDQRMSRCSGGEIRRAEIATAWLRRPVCLLADEPYRGVAPKDAEMLSDVFRAMVADGCAVVLTGHEVATVMDVATRVVWCTHGTTYELGTPAEASTHEQFRQEYLGPQADRTLKL
jgi:ABC-type multidrug transport system ATPase subunit